MSASIIDRIYIEEYITNCDLDLFVKENIHKLNKYKKIYNLKTIKWNSSNNSIDIIGNLNNINNVHEIIIKNLIKLKNI
jgi:hypothetical protein